MATPFTPDEDVHRLETENNSAENEIQIEQQFQLSIGSDSSSQPPLQSSAKPSLTLDTGAKAGSLPAYTRFGQVSERFQTPSHPSERWVELDIETLMAQDPQNDYDDQRRRRRSRRRSRSERYSNSTTGSSNVQGISYPSDNSSQVPLYQMNYLPCQNLNQNVLNYSLTHSRPSSAQAECFGNDSSNRYPRSFHELQRKENPPKKDEEDRSLDPDTVTWDGPQDPDNPKNWSNVTKWRVTILVSLFSFLSMFASSMLAPATGDISSDLHMSEQDSIISVSIFILGFAIGPFCAAPMSEVYGRMIVLQPSMALFLIFNVACSLARSKAELIAFRLLSGVGGSAALVIGGGILTDVWPRNTIGKASGIYTLAPLLGPPMGPLVAAFIVSATTWRWIFRAVCIADAVLQISALCFLPETYGPAILWRKLKRVRKETGNKNLHLESDSSNVRSALRISLIRPFRLLATQPIVQVIALYMAYIFGLFYLIITSFPRVWRQQYNQSISIGSLNYLSSGVGFIIGALINARISDRVHQRLTKKNGGKPIPEYRIPPMFMGSVLMPMGLFWYGFSANARAHWILPNLGMAVFASGSVLCIESMQIYIIESYRRYAASGMAVAVIARSIAGFAVPLAAPSMYQNLGLGWGIGVLAFIGIGIGIPAPFLFWFMGERLRKISQYAAG